MTKPQTNKFTGAEMSESCRCGSAVTVKGIEPSVAISAVREWEKSHRCLHDGERGKNDPMQGIDTTSHLGFRPSSGKGTIA